MTAADIYLGKSKGLLAILMKISVIEQTSQTLNTRNLAASLFLLQLGGKKKRKWF